MIDILIPSFRPDRIKECVDQIRKCSEGFDINIVIDSATDGTYAATNKMFNETSGEYVVHIPDDCLVQPLWLDRMMDWMKLENIYVGGWKTFNDHGTHEPCQYYGKNFCAFICIRRDIANQLGGLLDSRYHCFYGDPDLSMRAYEAGGRVLHLPTYDIFYHDKHDDLKIKNMNEWYQKDEDEFIKRWGNFK